MQQQALFQHIPDNCRTTKRMAALQKMESAYD